MTFKIPEKNFADKLLAMMGKERAVWMPKDVYKGFEHTLLCRQKRNLSGELFSDLKIKTIRRDGSV